MNLYARALGFDNLTSKAEEKFIKTGIKESIKEGFVIRHEKINRGVIILRLSKSTGLYIFGRFDKNIIGIEKRNMGFDNESYYKAIISENYSSNGAMKFWR